MKKLIIITLLALVPVGIIIFLSMGTRLNDVNNGFDRKFISTFSAESLFNIDETKARDVIGRYQTNYFFSTRDPREYIIYDSALQSRKTLFVPLADSLVKKIGKNYKTSMSLHNILILAGNIPAMINIDIRTQGVSIYRFDPPVFSNGISLSDESAAIRRIDVQKRDQLFYKVNRRDSSIVEEKNISPLNGDGGLSTSGHFGYSSETSVVTYTYHFINQFAVFDTNMNLLRKGNTIDTFSTYQLTPVITRKGSDHVVEAGSPPRLVNQTSCCYRNLLLITSNLKADNEQSDGYWNNVPLDIYNIEDGNYMGSIYLPLSGDQIILKMKAVEDKLVCLYSNRISVFRLNFN